MGENQHEHQIQENLNESEKRVIKGRPISSKGRTPKHRYRPNSANRAMSGKRRGLFKPKDVNPILLSKIKPQKVVINRMGKEKLYENNLALQIQFNKVKETNLRLKTRIHRLNKDLEKYEDMIEELRSGQNSRTGPQIRNFHLIGNLKTKISELNVEVKRKDDELALIKRSTRATKLLELEVQMQAYIDECTRLKHHLEEILKEKDYFPPDYGNADGAQHVAIINNLQRENQDLHGALEESRQEIEKWRKKALEKQSKSLKAKKGKAMDNEGKSGQEITKQKQVIESLKSQLEEATNAIREKDGMISLLQAKLQQVDKAEDQIVVKSEEYKFVPEPPSANRPKEQPRAKQFADQKPNPAFSFEKPDSSINESQTQKRKVPAPILTQSPSSSSSESGDDYLPNPQGVDVEETLKHISLRMQLHRLQKKEVGVTLFGGGYDEKKKHSADDLSRLFKEQPFELIDNSQRSGIVKFLLDSPTAVEKSAKEIVNRLLNELPDWQIFNPKDEKSFDKEIAIAISNNVGPFESACKVYDSDDSGFISLEHFESVTRKLGIKFSEKCLKYVYLLFYSHSFELNRVPYTQFIDAYGNVDMADLEDGEFSDEEEDDLSEEERAAIVRECLKVIADALKGKKARDVFQAEGPNLYPGEFLEGLRSIGVPDFDKQVFVIFIESLQSEEEEEQLCIDFEYLENLLDHYAEASFEHEGQIELDTAGDEDEERVVQRSVSILDSPRNELEYSEEDKQNLDKSTPPKSSQLSENSPFKTGKLENSSSSSSIKSAGSSGQDSIVEHSDKDESYDEDLFDDDYLDSDFEESEGYRQCQSH